MKLSFGTVLLVFIAGVTVSFAVEGQDFRPIDRAELEIQSAAVDPDAPAVILEWEIRRDDPKSTETEYYRIKIFNDEGKKHANIELPYLRGTTKITGIRARTIRPDGTAVNFDGKIYDKTIVRAGRVKLMAKTFTLPDVQQGSVVEYAFTRSWDRNTLYNTAWILQRELPIVRANLRLLPYNSTEFNARFVAFGLPRGYQPTLLRGGEWEVELTNVDRFVDEPFSPTLEQMSPRIHFFYDSRQISSPDHFWQLEAKEWSKIIEKFIGRPRDLEAQVKRVVGTASGEAALRSIYERIAAVDNLSYRSDDAAKGQRENKSAKDVFDNGYGYRNEINRLFVAMTRAAGFDAHVVRVAQRDDVLFRKELHDSRQLNGEITVVKLPSGDLYLDPGTPGMPFGLLSWENSDVPGLKIVAKGPAQWSVIPQQDASRAVLRRAADMRLTETGLSGRITVTFEGQEAARRRLSMFDADDAAVRKSVEDELKRWLPEGSAVKLATISGRGEPELPLIVEADVEIIGAGSAVGSRILLPMALFSGSGANPFRSETRRNPVYFDHQYTVEDRIEVEIPEDFEVETLPQAKLNDLKALRSHSSWTNGDRRVRLDRSLTVIGTTFDPQHYPKVRDFFSALRAADEETVLLRASRDR